MRFWQKLRKYEKNGAWKTNFSTASPVLGQVSMLAGYTYGKSMHENTIRSFYCQLDLEKSIQGIVGCDFWFRCTHVFLLDFHYDCDKN